MPAGGPQLPITGRLNRQVEIYHQGKRGLNTNVNHASDILFVKDFNSHMHDFPYTSKSCTAFH